VTLVKDCYTSQLLSLVLEMLIGLEVTLIDGPLMATVPLLVVILLPGVVKGRMSLLILVLKLSIELWLILLPRCYGFTLSFMTWVLIFLLLCRCTVTIRPLFLLLTIFFHECTKHIEVDYHFIQNLLMLKQTVTPYVHSDDQLGDILMKPLPRTSFQQLSNKLSMFDLYAPA
jgi:hypothetical protein